MNKVDQREEFLFIYDVTNANPNGNPLDENKPRIDEESGRNLVTDVRLKRTVRDYLFNFKGHDGSGDRDIFVRHTPSKKTPGGLQDGKARAADFGSNRTAILERCIDIRLFGGVLPLDKDSITLTGPVQLKMGRSLHRVAMTHIQGTGAFASADGKKQNTLREEYILPYSLICFYGVVNENTARHSGLTQADVAEFYQALWEGTKNLISRSKMGHIPRLLLRLIHREANFFFGDLDRYVDLVTDFPDERLRDIGQAKIDLSRLDALVATRADSVRTELRKGERVEVTGWNR